jgi:RNA polymerase sigma factor (sigma-70 family)
MSEDAQLVLLDYLHKRYASLKLSLTRMLGNDDLAADALHDTWLRLKGNGEHGAIQNPGAYLLRMTVNTALNIHRRQKRTLSGDDIDLLLEEMADPTPGPEHLAEARSDLAALQKIIDRMPLRRRKIVVLVHWEELTQKEVAQHLGISLRTVEYELKYAQDTLNASLNAEDGKDA